MANKGILLLFVVGLVVTSSAGFVLMSGNGTQPESGTSAQQTTEQAYESGVEYHPEDPGPKTQTIEYRLASNGTGSITINTTRVEKEVFERINEIRANNGLSTWEYSYRVASVSRSHSQEMAAEEYLDHYNEDGQPPWIRWEEMESERCLDPYGENIVKTSLRDSSGGLTANETNAQAMVDWWMDSPPHRQLILSEDPDYNYIGVGAYFDGEEGKPPIYGTMNVCGPEDPDAPFESSSAS